MRSLALALFLASAARAFGDEVELEDGKIIEGKVQDLGDSVKIVKSGGSVTYPKHMIKRIEYKKTPEEVYVERARDLKDADLEGHLKLARWCQEKKLFAEAKAEFQKIVALSPDHEEARTALGFRKLDGKWLSEDEWAAAKGLVKHKGKWMTPEQRDLDVALDEQKVIDERIGREVKLQLERTHSGDEKKRQEAKDALSRIDDKYKRKLFVEALTTYHKETRGFVIEDLGRMKEPAAARPLCRRALWDDEEPFRALALKALQEIDHPDTALFFVPFLQEESVSARIRCADALATFKDPRAVPALAEALETCLETMAAMEKYGEQMTAIVNSQVVLRDGTRVTLPKLVRLKPELFDRKHLDRLRDEKSSLVATLRSVTGQDLGEDPNKWRAWYARQKK